MRKVCILLVLMLAACSPESQPYVETSASHPSIGDNSFITADNTSLPSRNWLPKTKPKAVIVALHGFNDYSNAFNAAGTYFKTHGVATFAYDQRGFGGSPHTGIWGGEQNLIGDLRQYVGLVAARYPRTPIFLLGESMGGAVAVTAMADPQFPPVKGVILVAPALWGDETMNPLYRTALWMAAHTIPEHELSGHELHILASDNIPMLQQMGADPLVLKKARVDAVYGIVHLMDNAYEKAPTVKTPALILYGACDQVIPSEPIAKTLEHFHTPVTFAYYPEGYHMLLRDLQGEVVMEDVLHWMQNPQETLPSGYEADTMPEQKRLEHCRHIVVKRGPDGSSNLAVK